MISTIQHALRNRRRKHRMAVVAREFAPPVEIPRRFNPDSPLWGQYAQRLCKALQKRWGIPQTGVADAATLDHLYPFRRVRGIDVSVYQGPLDWHKLYAQGVRFAIGRASHGMSADASYPTHRKGAASAGIRWGAYHFAYASRSTGVAQARYFLSLAQPRPGDLAPMLDVEVMDGLADAAMRGWIDNFASVVEDAVGLCGYYGSPSFTTDLHLARQMASRPLWVAHYGVTHPTVPPPWHSYAIWQSAAGEHHPTGLDQNEASAAALAHLTIKAQP